MNKTILAVFLVLSFTGLNGQQQAEHFILDQPLTGQQIFEAQEFIEMIPGFEYEAVTPNDLFSAGINPWLLFPPMEGVTGGPPGGAGGEGGVVGNTGGAFSVSETGQAIYVIPLEFPGGVAGMTPDLSLVYNSNGGDGILGPGWSLAGLSVISLVPATRHHDGIKNAAYGLDYYANSYTLDGQKLIRVSNLPGGGANNPIEFKTEQDVFSRIMRKPYSSPDGKGKDITDSYFEVQTKAGLIYYYGNDPTSRHYSILNENSFTVAYYVNRIEDNFGNAIIFEYENIHETGEIYIQKIIYTINSTSLAGIFEINFKYTERNSPLISYFTCQPASSSPISFPFKTAKKIQAIECVYKPSNDIVKEYVIEYVERGPGFDSQSKIEHISSVQEFGIGGELIGEEKYNKIVFEWEEEMNYNTFETLSISLPQTIYQSYAVNGVSSLVRNVEYHISNIDNDLNPNVIRTYERVFREPSGWSWDCTHTIIVEVLKPISDSQFEIDGHMVIPYQSYTQDYATIISEGSFTVAIADFNGTGRNDLVLMKRFFNRDSWSFTGTEINLYLNDGTGFFTNISVPVFNSLAHFFYLYTGDFNGDGIADILLQNTNLASNNLIWRLGSLNNPLDDNSDSKNGLNLIYNPQDQNLIGLLQNIDFNGDGRTDLMKKVGNNLKVFSIVPESEVSDQMDITTQTISDFSNDNNCVLCNINSDNKTDLIVYSTEVNWVSNSPVFEAMFTVDSKLGTGQGFVGSGTKIITHSFTVSELVSILGVTHTTHLQQFNNLFGNGRNAFVLRSDITVYGLDSYNHEDTEEFSTSWLLFLTSDGSFITEYELNDEYFYKSFGNANLTGNNQSDAYRIKNFESNNSAIINIRKPSQNGSRINKITNALGSEVKIEYGFSSDPGLYTPGATADHPVIPYEVNQVLVKKVERDNGQAGFFVEEYHYDKARAHTEGLGYLGFETTIRTDVTRGIRHTTKYGLDPTYYYTYPAEQTVSLMDGTLIKKTTNNYAHKTFSPIPGKTYYFVYPVESMTRHYDPDPNQMFKVEKTEYDEFDNYGNPVKITSSFGDSENPLPYKTQTIHYYSNYVDDERWILGRLDSANTTTSAPGTADITRKSAFEYYGQEDGNKEGMLEVEITEPDEPTKKTTKTYKYDDYGNIESSTLSATGLESRATETQYTDDGRFVNSTKNAMEHEITREYEPKLGTLTSQTDLDNDLTSEFYYDDFGRLRESVQPDGNRSVSVLRWVIYSDNQAPANAIYYSWSQTSGSSPVKVYYNKLGMELRSVSIGFEGIFIFIDTDYNEKGQTLKKSEPYFQGETAIFYTHFHYDVLGRLIKILHTDNTETGFSYQGNETTTTNQKGQVSKKTVNAAGWLVLSEDALGGKVQHTYFSNGQVKSTKVLNFENSKREYTYDETGNLETYKDASQGDLSFVYNAYGELTKEENPNGITQYTEYDKLGRLKEKISPEGITTWDYDGQKVGLLDKVKMVSGGTTVHQLNYEYDEYLRVIKEDETISGELFSTGFEFDHFGRLKTLIYPSGYAVEHAYNQYGYPYKINAEEGDKLIWEATEMNARNQFMHVNLGTAITQNFEYFDNTGRIKKISATGLQNNDYNWDNIGNLTYRKTINGKAEGFGYDFLNRLTTVYHNGLQALSLTYDALGNITSKSDVGVYSYTDASNPYKITSINNLPSTMTSDNQSISYNSFNKVEEITETDPVTLVVKRQMQLTYGVTGQRIKQVMLQQGQPTTQKLYVGAIYEKETVNGQSTLVHYIQSPTGLAAVMKRTDQGDQLNFVLNDHLGSIQVLASENGTLLEEYSYDPWGLRRDPVTLEVYASISMPVTGIKYGFTGHEHIDIFMLVNMNGRIYDPVLGRFLSPDPVLQFPNFTQGLNPYAYVLNNPLRFVDPDGYSLVGQLVALTLSMAVATIPGVNILLPPLIYSVVMTIDYAIEQGRNVSGRDLFGYFVQTFVMSGLSAGVSSGIGDYFKAAKNQNLLELRRALAHGIFNGTMRFAQGGKFEHGFMSGFVSSLGGSYMQMNAENMSIGAQVAMSAVIGGTAEKLGGGKFANGAVTGAYVMMFNHLQTVKEERTASSGRRIDFSKASDEERIIHIMNSIRDASQNGQEFIDMRQIFINLPDYGTGIDMADNIKIGESSLIVHMNLAVYDNMRIDISPARMGQVGPFKNVYVRGIVKNGYWDMMEFNRSRGNIPMLMIQTNANFDIFYDYLYK
jgi:RHS repeat-associated protein